jgi:hypothetical protein
MTQGLASHRKLRLYQPRREYRTDWNEIEHNCEMALVAADLLGPSPRRCGDDFWWQCPFHNGSSPSLWIAVGDSRWACMGCSAGGNAVALVMRVKKIGFREAIDWLCNWATSASSTSFPAQADQALVPPADPEMRVRPSSTGRMRLCWHST